MLGQIEAAFAQRTMSEDRLRRFLADASHELRTPLTSIRGYAELLRKGAFRHETDRQRALTRIESEAARMGDLVGDLLTLARLGEGPEPERRRVDLVPVVRDAVADARTVDPTRTITVHAADRGAGGRRRRPPGPADPQPVGQCPGPHAGGHPGLRPGGRRRRPGRPPRAPTAVRAWTWSRPASLRPLLPRRRRPGRRRVRAGAVHRGGRGARTFGWPRQCRHRGGGGRHLRGGAAAVRDGSEARRPVGCGRRRRSGPRTGPGSRSDPGPGPTPTPTPTPTADRPARAAGRTGP